jgi:hypothetical protein
VTPTYFIDRCLGLYELPRRLRAAGMDLVTHAELGIAHDEEDVHWIPKVAADRYVILTSDRDIRKNPLEHQAVVSSSAWYFVLGRGSRTAQRNAEIITRHRATIEMLVTSNPGPVIAQLNADDLLELRDGKWMKVKRPRRSR